MHELVGRLDGAMVTADGPLEREFEANLPHWSRLAFRVAYSVLRQREDAEDVAQDALVKAHRQLRQLRDPERLRAWLVRMAWRMAIDRRHADERRRAREQTSVAVPSRRSCDDAAVSAERAAELWALIDGLSEKLRMVVVLASIEGHDLAEVASILGIPAGTVKSRLFEARRQLRERLQ
jgi:RNA polymerase sigma-70 factor (ECF subfamily)